MTLFDCLENPDMPGHVATNPVVHRNDPETSRLAAKNLETSGRRDRHIAIVVALVRRLPGRTACELFAEATPGEREILGEMQEIRRRLTDAKAAGLVRQSLSRPCRERGTKMVTWEAVS